MEIQSTTVEIAVMIPPQTALTAPLRTDHTPLRTLTAPEITGTT